MNLIIPMAGQGKRFRNAGFSTFKPFIPINGKLMLDYVIDRFPASIRKFVVTSLSLLTEEEIDYLVNEKENY